MNKYWSLGAAAKFMGLVAALAVAGCAGTNSELRNEPNYGLGYNDGCSTANGRVSGFDKTVRRNENLYESDRGYSAGWKDGFASCGGTTNRDRDVFGGEDRWYDQGPL